MKTFVTMIAALLALATAPEHLCGYSSVFPKGTTVHDPAKAYAGYTLYCTTIDNDPRCVVMVDMDGNLVNTWNVPKCRLGCNLQPLANGNILTFAVIDEADTALAELDWNSNILWSYHDSVHHRLHHDFERLSNGNTIILCHEIREVPQISRKGIVDDYILEIDPQGNVLWEWYTHEHFEALGLSAEALELIYEQGRDWTHTNSIQSLPANPLGDPRFKEGNILVSQRNTSVVFIIDRPSGDIVWKTDPNQGISLGQHNTQLLRPGQVGAGGILMFDNGGIAGYPEQARLYSRVIEIDPFSFEKLWEYNGYHSGQNAFSFFSPLMSGAQRLPNGNTLICEADTGRLFEITRDKEIVWEYINPYFHPEKTGESNEVYRAWRVEFDWAGR